MSTKTLQVICFSYVNKYSVFQKSFKYQNVTKTFQTLFFVSSKNVIIVLDINFGF